MADDLLGDVLRQVSRSFYLSLAILPRALREPLGLAYLLARAADSVADTRLVPRGERLAHLRTLRAAFVGGPHDVGTIVARCAAPPAQAPERRLLTRLPDVLARLEALSKPDRDIVHGVVATLTDGMVFDLERFPGDDAASLAALETLDELDRYTYLVAGCVGEAWTALHVAHRPRLAGWDVDAMSALAVRFGKALQLTNVLRDVPSDLAQGRCYLPARALAGRGVAPRDLLDRAGRARARPVLDGLLGVAVGHYDAAWAYTIAIPRREWRMRLACVWPLAIGLATLRRVAEHPDPLGAGSPIKIPRREVRAIVTGSLGRVLSNAALRADAARRTSPLRKVTSRVQGR